MSISVLIITGLVLMMFLVVAGAIVTVQMKKEEMEKQFKQELTDLTKYHSKIELGGVIKKYLNKNEFVIVRCDCGTRVKVPREMSRKVTENRKKAVCPKCKLNLGEYG